MSFPRSSGILLHPTSLPGRSGIGDMGKPARDFVDFLEETGQRLWQVLPLGPTGYGDSPYQCLSAFAGNPMLVSLEDLVAEGLLDSSDLDSSPDFPEERVIYGEVIEYKTGMLDRAHQHFIERSSKSIRREYLAFTEEASWWLDDYAVYRAIKDEHDGRMWTEWEPYLRDMEDMAMHYFRENHQLEIDRHKFYQFLFFRQWLELARYANKKGISVVGDIPIFVAHDSADVWANRELFYLDKKGRPTRVAGVPPDYFSETGQLWGNPLYRWEVMAKDDYQWWLKRIRAALSMVDIVRLDHFRGFEKYWAVPASETTAVSGEWETGPGAGFFEAVKAAFQDAGGVLPIIAEDLGYITEEVRNLRDGFGFPGMRILQFAFGTDPEADEYKPYNIVPNSVVYTGTHDNDTTIGWFTGKGNSTRSDDDINDEREFVLKYLGTDGSEINWDFIRLALASVANTAIIPMQDLLSCGNEARMNVPSRESGNWEWRFRRQDVTGEIRERLAEMTEIYGRSGRRLKSQKETSSNEVIEVNRPASG